MPSVELTDQEWQQLIALVSDAPWKIAHPLLMKIGGQLNATSKQAVAPPQGIRLDGNGKEARNE